jgi:hypothetical protein
MSFLNRHRKALFIVLLLCVTGVAQYGAMLAEPESHHASDHCCRLCHAGPLQFLQSSASAGLAPFFEVAWLAPAVELAPLHDVRLSASAARAPPAS